MTKFTEKLKVGVLDADFPEVGIRGGLLPEAVVSGSLPVSGTNIVVTAAGFVLVDVITTAGTTVAAKIPFFNV